jgi:hypothetical protein
MLNIFGNEICSMMIVLIIKSRCVMVAFVILAFLAGGMVGMVAMAMLSCGPKLLLMRENSTLKHKLQVLEPAARSRRIVHIREPEAVFQEYSR